ncbi:hypothetical protein GCM10009818_36770 [Nakamurella flavida]
MTLTPVLPAPPPAGSPRPGGILARMSRRTRATLAVGVVAVVGLTTVLVVDRGPAPPPPSPSGEYMPVGDLPGWHQVLAEDFLTDAAPGEFPGPYADHWTSYDGFPDTFGHADYTNDIITVRNGVLDEYLHTNAEGRAQAAAPVPYVSEKWAGQTYGRFSVRFRADPLQGFGTGWLLWPDSDKWDEGEMDFPEGRLDGQISGYNHCIGNPRKICGQVHTGVTYTDWHTATIEWLPGKLSYYLDGALMESYTDNVPDTPFHWVLQTGTRAVAPDPDVAGHVEIDWVAIYTPA